ERERNRTQGSRSRYRSHRSPLGAVCASSGGDVMPIASKTPFRTTPQVSFNFWSQPVYQRDNGELYTPGIDGNTYASNPGDYLYLGVPTTNPYTPGLCEVIV